MRRTLAATPLIFAFAAAAAGASASPAQAPSPAAARASFGRLLHQLYGGVHGYWTCPRQYPPSITCRNALGDVMRYRPGG